MSTSPVVILPTMSSAPAATVNSYWFAVLFLSLSSISFAIPMAVGPLSAAIVTVSFCKLEGTEVSEDVAATDAEAVELPEPPLFPQAANEPITKAAQSASASFLNPFFIKFPSLSVFGGSLPQT